MYNCTYTTIVRPIITYGAVTWGSYKASPNKEESRESGMASMSVDDFSNKVLDNCSHGGPTRSDAVQSSHWIMRRENIPKIQ